MIQCLLLSGSLYLFSADGNSVMNLSHLTHLWKENSTIKSNVDSSILGANNLRLEGLPEDMTLFQIMQQCDNVAWENYDEVVSD